MIVAHRRAHLPRMVAPPVAVGAMIDRRPRQAARPRQIAEQPPDARNLFLQSVDPLHPLVARHITPVPAARPAPRRDRHPPVGGLAVDTPLDPPRSGEERMDTRQNTSN